MTIHVTCLKEMFFDPLNNLTDELAWFLFLILPHWCLGYTQGDG
jgi:hypothetical protein